MRINNLANERIGTVGYNKNGYKMVIVEYENVSNILVQFELGNPVSTTWVNFSRGQVKYPFEKSVFGVGYIGEGKYKSRINKKMTKVYNTWVGMMSRCYNEKKQNRQPTYRICYVAEEWHNFQVFAKWHDENYYEVEVEKMQLDKDIIVKDCKIYSPETCVFVPQRVNLLFVTRKAERGDFPLGVGVYNGKYTASCSNEHIGTFDTPEEAFNAYKVYKEELIKTIADKYKDKISEKLYIALNTYEVEFTD